VHLRGQHNQNKYGQTNTEVFTAYRNGANAFATLG